MNVIKSFSAIVCLISCVTHYFYHEMLRIWPISLRQSLMLGLHVFSCCVVSDNWRLLQNQKLAGLPLAVSKFLYNNSVPPLLTGKLSLLPISPIQSLVSVPTACMRAKLFQSCPTLCDSMDCSPPGSSVHGILQARALEWVASPSSKGSSKPRYWTHVSYWQAGSLPLAPPGKPLCAHCHQLISDPPDPAIPHYSLLLYLILHTAARRIFLSFNFEIILDSQTSCKISTGIPYTIHQASPNTNFFCDHSTITDEFF